MTDRIPLDDLTSDQLDQLYDELGRLQIANRALTTAAVEAVQRAEQAEDLLRIAHDTSNKSETERARAVERAERAEAERDHLAAAASPADVAVRAIQLMQEAGRERDELRAAIARVREYAATSDDDSIQTRQNILRIVGEWTGLDETTPTAATQATDGEIPAAEPFFEVGKVYGPKGGSRWEIRFQREGTAHFSPARVDRDSAGLLLAYGKLSLDGDHVWTTMDRFAFGAWKAADRPATEAADA